MKEFLKKSWLVIRMWALLLIYTLIGLPYAMWTIAQVIFEQGITNADFDTIIQRVSEGLKYL